jgi:hypothetical protein
MRYMVVQEPTDSWAVFDTTVNEPADFASQCLVGLTRDSAEWFALRCAQEASRRDGQCVQNSTPVATSCLADSTDVHAYSWG